MRYRYTIADWQRRYDESERWCRRKNGAIVIAPADTGVLAVVSRYGEGCLTHLVRYVVAYHPDWRDPHRSFATQCGYSFAEAKVDVIDPAGEMFGCARCIAVAERYGEPTYSLVPSTGCEQSQGRRGLRGRRPSSSHQGASR
jgi:hypothetical protein